MRKNNNVMENEKTYSAEELIEDLHEFITKVGGTITCVDPLNFIFKIEVTTTKKEYVFNVVQTAVENYKRKRGEYLLTHPLDRILDIKKRYNL